MTRWRYKSINDKIGGQQEYDGKRNVGPSRLPLDRLPGSRTAQSRMNPDGV